MQPMRKLVNLIVPKPESAETRRQLVYRAAPARAEDCNCIGNGSWEKRIIELSDGKSVGEISDALFRQEIMAGASAADIGLWKHLFYRSVVNTIVELADEGYIQLKPGDPSKEE